MKWNNEVLEQRFNLFNRLIKKGFRIYVTLKYQIESGMYHNDPVTNLPYPDQEKNAFGDVALVTYETKVYLPKISDVGSDGQLFAVQQTYAWDGETIIGITNA